MGICVIQRNIRMDMSKKNQTATRMKPSVTGSRAMAVACVLIFLTLLTMRDSRAEDARFTIIHSSNVGGYLYACPT